MAAVAFILLFGGATGLLAVFDTPISLALSHMIPVTIDGKNVFELYPYEVSSLIFASLLVFYLIRNIPKSLFLEKEKYYIIALLVTYETYSLFNFGPIDGSDIVVGFFIISFFVAKSIQRENMTYQFLDILNLLLLMSLIISAVNAGFGGIFTLANAFLKGSKVLFLSFLLVNSVLKTGPRVFIRWLLIFTTLSAVVGIVQEAAYVFTGKVIVGVLPKSQLKNMFDTFMSVNIFRVPAFTSGYKFFSALLIFGILIELNLLLYHKMKKKTVLLMLASMSLMGIGLLLTFSKDSWLVCSAAIAISLIVRWPFLIIYNAIISLPLIPVLALTRIPDHLLESASAMINWQEYRIRIQLARDGIHGFLGRHTIIGGGVGKAPRYVGNFNGWPPHNLFVTTADETGLFGLSVYIFLIGYTFYKCISWNLDAKAGYDAAVSRGILLSFLSYVLLVQFEPGFLDINLWLLMGFIHGMSILHRRARTGVIRGLPAPSTAAF